MNYPKVIDKTARERKRLQRFLLRYNLDHHQSVYHVFDDGCHFRILLACSVQ